LPRPHPLDEPEILGKSLVPAVTLHSGERPPYMNNFYRNLSLIFAAGAFGGLVKALVA
jgi:hypothetical protein